MEKAQFTDSDKDSTNSTWSNRQELSIAQGALTNSKRPECLVKGVYPTHLERGSGCIVFDTNGKSYIDFICGLGSNLVGYGNTTVAKAVTEQFLQGATLSLATTKEVLFAEKVKEIFPFIEKMKVLKTGSDACTAAIRIARTHRKMGKVLSEGYHGFHDEFVSLSPPALGVYGSFPIEKLTDLTDIDYETAAVIVEPIMTDLSDARIAWLRELRARCTETGAALIFDEVITGFRFPKLSVSTYLGITPDLICMGKAMGGGLPIAVVGGSKEIMESGEYFVSSTFAGETVSMAASLKVMELLQKKKLDVEELWEKGNYFKEEFNKLWPGVIAINGYPTRGVFEADLEIKALFWQEACRAGIIFGPSWFFNFHHIEWIEGVLNTCKDIVMRLKTNSVKLQGELPKTPFAQKLRK